MDDTCPLPSVGHRRLRGGEDIHEPSSRGHRDLWVWEGREVQCGTVWAYEMWGATAQLHHRGEPHTEAAIQGQRESLHGG